MRRISTFLRRHRGDFFVLWLALVVLGVTCTLGGWYSRHLPRATLSANGIPYAISPDAQWVVVQCSDMTFDLINTLTGLRRGLEPVGERNIVGMVFASDGKTLAGWTSGFDQSFWDVASGARLMIGSKDERLWFLGFSPDGRKAILGGTNDHWEWYGLTIVDTAAGARERQLKSARGPVSFSHDGSLLAAWKPRPRPGLATNYDVAILDTSTWEEIAVLEADVMEPWAIRFSPDGCWLASMGHYRSHIEGLNPGYDISVWNVSTKERCQSFPYTETSTYLELHFTARSDALALIVQRQMDRDLLVFEVPSGAPPTRERLPRVWQAAPDGSLLALALASAQSPYCTIQIKTLGDGNDVTKIVLPDANADVAGVRSRWTYLSPEDYLRRMAFTPDGRLLVVQGHRHRRFFQPKLMELLPDLFNWLRTGAEFRGVSYRVVNETAVYDTQTCKLRSCHREEFAAALSPDSMLLITTNGSRLALWDLPPRKPWNRILAWSAIVGLFTLLLGQLILLRRALSRKRRELLKLPVSPSR